MIGNANSTPSGGVTRRRKPGKAPMRSQGSMGHDEEGGRGGQFSQPARPNHRRFAFWSSVQGLSPDPRIPDGPPTSNGQNVTPEIHGGSVQPDVKLDRGNQPARTHMGTIDGPAPTAFTARSVTLYDCPLPSPSITSGKV
jgi:hypothetical protein